MDRLFNRYADPFLFINGMIRSGRFDEFVSEFMDTLLKEKEDQVNWDFFLHKVFDGTYSDFIAEMENNKKNQNLSERTIETTVNHSMKILNGFNPDEGGE
jgi:hypothetical protein